MRGNSSRLSVSRETITSRYFSGREDEITRYGEILATVAIERGLIGPAEANRIWERHIENCIPVSTLFPKTNSFSTNLLKEGKRLNVADIGSGAGLPGIVIALARPDLHITLIEPLKRRVDFLNEVIATLGLKNEDIEVIWSKAEGVKTSFNYLTSRAVAPLPRLLTTTWHLLRPGGSILAIKGEAAASEIAESDLSRAASHTLHEIRLEGLPVARVVEVVKPA